MAREEFFLGRSGASFSREGDVIYKRGGARLRLCAEKQRTAAALGWLHAPRVLGVSSVPGGVVFAQERVDGVFPLGAVGPALRAASAAAAFVLGSPDGSVVSVEPMLQRLDTVACEVALRERVSARLKMVGSLPGGRTHGDLTYCNLIDAAVGVVAVDWCNPTVESPMLDAVKLRQDTFHGWAARLTDVDADAAAQADAYVHRAFAALPRYAETWAVVSAWSLLCRVFTYATDNATRQWAEEEAMRCELYW